MTIAPGMRTAEGARSFHDKHERTATLGAVIECIAKGAPLGGSSCVSLRSAQTDIERRNSGATTFGSGRAGGS
ncbi:hypothetical protein [uncultured Nevskia sp.]|uniref:hypothetical protein n=1 Tax=uncultured Nevskia sp. TaxID=228950 RepID=UPI002600B41E|nr:hypothetical protein [uncultured Nevskia sp.]